MSDSPASQPRTYVPRYSKSKVLVAVFGFAIAAAGVLQLREPVTAIACGRSAIAEVTAIVEERPGAASVVHRAPRAFEEDGMRRIVYAYEISLPDRNGPSVLNLKNRLRPVFEVGDGIRVAWVEGSPHVFAVWDARTWVPGGLLAAVGSTVFVAFLMLFLKSKKPIELPGDIPADAKM
jgi:hypothetical protein